ncbi:hypothetical protein VaNZ11_007116 [Volvox africanus]|uniref:YHYH domain-containing protein n=1 Tax=Volvox africanus TaxID=51714 RepID=A0ABQ5S2G6_9CHLO|nr:hypothetical protein VaNZ11_007116 [Volvox africanus]
MSFLTATQILGVTLAMLLLPSSFLISGNAQTTSGAGTSNCPKGNGQVVRLNNLTATEYTIFFSGCPPYDPSNQTTPNKPSFQNKTATFRVNPVISANATYVGRFAKGNTTNPVLIMGTIGYSVTGIALFNDANAQSQDAYVMEAHTFDGCRGHAEVTGTYHFHSEPGPGCVYNDTAGKHSPLLGIMFDSIPIYGALGDNGVAPKDLDECGGHTDSTYSFYHYHTTYNLTAPYLVKCFRGCIFNANGNPLLINNPNLVKSDTTCIKAATQYNYSSFVNSFTSSIPQSGTPGSTAAACRLNSWLAAMLLLAWALAMPGIHTA